MTPLAWRWDATPWTRAAGYLREGSLCSAALDEWEATLQAADAADGVLLEILADFRTVFPLPSRLPVPAPSANQRWRAAVASRLVEAAVSRPGYRPSL